MPEQFAGVWKYELPVFEPGGVRRRVGENGLEMIYYIGVRLVNQGSLPAPGDWPRVSDWP
ncbi:MAG: hypothetical protein AAF235_07240 [Planctomycetota bacterium]